MRILFLFSFLLLQASSFAQLTPIGGWRDHFPFSKTIDVAYTPGKVYAATISGLFYLDLEDNSINKITKVNGLSDIGLSRIAYDNVSNRLIIGYSNGNLDLINPSDNSTINLSDIKRSNVVGDKTIYGISPDGSGKAYLSTGFGIVYLDIQREEIKETYYLAPSGTAMRINQVCVLNDSIFAATENGVYRALKTNPFLSNYTSWALVTSLPASLQAQEFLTIVNFQNTLVCSYSSSVFGQDSLYRFDGATWQSMNIDGADVLRLKSEGDKLLVCLNYNVRVFDYTFTEIENIYTYTFSTTAEPTACVFGAGRYWIADKVNGLVRAITSWDNSNVIPSGPYSKSAFKIKISESDVWLAHGVLFGSAWLNSYNKDFVSGRVEDTWKSLGSISDPNNFLNGDSIFDFISLAIDPDNSDHVYAGSMSFGGLVEITDNVVTAKYDESNSTLQAWTLRPGYCGVTELVLDADNNLWALNAFVDKALSVKKADNTWKAFDLGTDMKNKAYREMIIGKFTGLFWIAVPSSGINGGLFVWNNNETIDDESDDEYFLYKTGVGQGNLPSADVLCVVEDLDEEIWIGTGSGIAVVYNQSSVFNGAGFDAQQILIEQDGNIQILFETEVIRGIAVDGANRKWVATDGSGVYLMSADGTEQLLHFTSENSPLLSDQVNDVEIDHRTGEVYFATSEGVISYRGTATIEEVPYSSAYAFPNPVMPDYEGVIAIKGLGRDADVKITDIAGNVVFVTKSEGGQAIWDGKNLKGERVATGVYTVLCNSETGSGKVVAKILFYN